MPIERDTDSERLARLHVLDELRATADDLHTLAKLAQVRVPEILITTFPEILITFLPEILTG
jgi:hypothetical protein